MASGSEDRQVLLSKYPSLEQETILYRPTAVVTDVCFTADDAHLVIASEYVERAHCAYYLHARAPCYVWHWFTVLCSSW